MKLYATIKNDRGGKKSISDDTRILVEFTYKNKIVGTAGLYSITDNGQDVGYRVVWQDERGFSRDNTIREEVKESRSDLWNCKHDTKCDAQDITFCKDNIPF